MTRRRGSACGVGIDNNDSSNVHKNVNNDERNVCKKNRSKRNDDVLRACLKTIGRMTPCITAAAVLCLGNPGVVLRVDTVGALVV